MTLVSETSHQQNNCGNHKAALNDKPTNSPQWFFIRSTIFRFSFEDKSNFAFYNKDYRNVWTPRKHATIIMRMFRQSTWIKIKITTPGFRVVVASLDSINSWSIQMLLRGENDSKQSDEIQAIWFDHEFETEKNLNQGQYWNSLHKNIWTEN